MRVESWPLLTLLKLVCQNSNEIRLRGLPHRRLPIPLGALILSSVHPLAFQLGPLRVTWYGILVVCGFMAGLWTASLRGRRYGIPSETILDMGPWLMVGVIV